MSQNPLVSIVIPAYNSQTMIAEAIESCLAQTYQSIEIIVVDDGSTDGTSALLRERYGQRVRCLRQDNAGPGIARNHGIESAQGEWVKFLDADDQLYPAHIERCVQALAEAGEDTALVYTRYRFVAEDGLTPLPEMHDPPLLNGDIFCDLLKSNSNAILTSAAMARRDALLAVGAFAPKKDLRHSEDWDLFLRLAAAYRAVSVDEILLDYRWYDTSLSHNAYQVAWGRLKVIRLARYYSGRAACIADAQYDKLEAARCHVVAVEAWKCGRRAEARALLQEAIRLNPDHTLMRRLLWLMSFAFPAQAADTLAHLLNQIRR